MKYLIKIKLICSDYLNKKSKLCYVIEQDKENDSRNAQATQAVIQRRRRPKRRSTGVVHVDMDVSNTFMKLSRKLY